MAAFIFDMHFYLKTNVEKFKKLLREHLIYLNSLQLDCKQPH